MTLKQLCKEIDRCKKERDDAIRTKEKWIVENVHPNIVADQDRWIAHWTKQIAKYTEMYPEIKRIDEEKMLKKIAKQQIKEKASTIGYIVDGSTLRGVTPDGKRWYAEHNHYGWTERTLHCYTLHIAEMGVIFTSGTIEKVLATVAQH